MDVSQGIETSEQAAADEAFAREIREWLEENLSGKFAELKGLGGPGREHEAFEERLEWDRHLAAAGWTCLGWPKEYGGREATLSQQIIFHQEYARANAPARVSHIGEELLGPTLIAFGTEEQKQRFLPGIKTVTELWCQGYSEPGAGSDLANVSTTARLDGDQWVVNGQKVWTSLAHLADWCFVVARTEPGSSRHKGLSYLLVPMNQEGVEVRPIIQLTGTSEFNEVFFDNARTDADLVVGGEGNGWGTAMGTLTFERGVSTLGSRSASPVSSSRSSNWPSATVPPRIRRSATRSPARGRACRSSVPTRCARSRASTPVPTAARRPSRSCCGPTGTAGSASSRWRSRAPRR